MAGKIGRSNFNPIAIQPNARHPKTIQPNHRIPVLSPFPPSSDRLPLRQAGLPLFVIPAEAGIQRTEALTAGRDQTLRVGDLGGPSSSPPPRGERIRADEAVLRTTLARISFPFHYPLPPGEGPKSPQRSLFTAEGSRHAWIPASAGMTRERSSNRENFNRGEPANQGYPRESGDPGGTPPSEAIPVGWISEA